MIKMSVIMPVYNEAAVLAESLDSALAQSLKEIEVICVDDGSTDASVAILREYASKDPRVKVLTQPNSGPAAARNLALAEASGEFVTFLDADDRYPESTTLEKLHGAAVENGVKVCGGGIEIVGEGHCERTFTGAFAGNAFAESGVRRFFDYQYSFGFTRFIYSRQLLSDNGVFFPALRYFEDPPFMVRALAAAGEFMALDFPTYSVRHEEKPFNWFSNGCGRVLDLLEGLRLNLVFAKEKGYAELREHSCRLMDWQYAKAIRMGLEKDSRVDAALKAVEAVAGYESRPREIFKRVDDKKIKLFMVYHKDSPRLDAYPFVPIQVGPAPDIPGIEYRDDFNDSIAAKNPNFCELTAQYWIWKNVKADYVGLMHYRRLIPFNGCSDWTFTDFSPVTCRRFGWNAESVEKLLAKYDILMPPNDWVFPPGEPYHIMTPYEFHCYEHRKGDIDAALAAIRDVTPEFADYADRALCKSHHECFGNICVMRKDLFDAYSEWLFKVLFEVERRIEIPANKEEARLFGFLSERLVMVWLLYAGEKLGARVWHAKSMPFGDFPEDIHPALAVKPHAAVADPKVSVVIPVYNVERYLPKCLNSVCGQCLDEIEVICVDDGSTDASPEILRAAAEKDRRIRVIKGEHRGPGAARNRGIAEARGKYLAFVDSDDWVDRFIWFRTVRKAERDGLDLVLFYVERVDDGTGLRTPDYLTWLGFDDQDAYHGVFTWRTPNQSPFRYACYPVNRIIRRDLWGDKKFPEGLVMGEDMPVHISVMLESGRIGILRCPFYYYRQRPGSSMTHRDRTALDHLAVVGLVLDYIERRGWLEDLEGHWSHFSLDMIDWAYKFWPTEECFRETAKWIADRRELFEGCSCFCLRVLCKCYARGNYRLFVAVRLVLWCYRDTKDWIRGTIGKVQNRVKRGVRWLKRKM